MTKSCLRSAAMFVTLMSAACSAPWQQPIKLGPADTGAGTLASARQYLEGRWGLLDYDVMQPGQSPVRLTGGGTLVYDGFGNLDVEIRVDEATATRLEDFGIPSKNGVVSMKGRAVVDMQARTLTYMLEGQPPLGAPSSPLALNRPRHWEVEGDVLTLTTRGADGQALSIGRWQKTP